MTDADIREWLADYDAGKHQDHTDHDLQPLLKELLEHRNLRLTPCWRVWVPDNRTDQGWRWVAAFSNKESAENYRAELWLSVAALVLPWNEQPALTAR